MPVILSRSDLEKFIAEQVDAGRYPSPEAAVEAAVEQMMAERSAGGFTPEDWKTIAEADAAFDRGQGIDFDTFAAEMRKRYCGR